MVASHTAAPLGGCEMAGKRHHTPKTLPLGKGQEQHMSPTQGQADIKRATFAPAISKHPKAFLYGWLPLSDAFGIFSLLMGMIKTKGNDRISVTPSGFYPLSPDLQGFRCASPPACNLTPLRGLCGSECRMLQGNCYIMIKTKGERYKICTIVR